MTSYFSNSRLIQQPDSQYEFYSFEMVEDLYNVLQYNEISAINLNFQYNIISIPDNDAIFNMYDEVDNESKDSKLIIFYDKQENECLSKGNLKKGVIVKENNKKYQEINKNANRKSDENSEVLYPVNRKRISNLNLEKEMPAKKSVSNKNLESDDDLASRSTTRPRVPRSFATKKKIDILDQLRYGKSMIEVSDMFNISEEMITKFKEAESEIRKQYQESLAEQFPVQPQIEPVEKIPVTKKQVPSKPPPKVARPSNIIPKVVEKSPERSNCILNLDFPVHKENGKLVFGDCQKAFGLTVPSFTIQLDKDHPDIPKVNSTKKTADPNRKPMENRNSNLIPRPVPHRPLPDDKRAPISRKPLSESKSAQNFSQLIPTKAPAAKYENRPMKSERTSNEHLKDRKPFEPERTTKRPLEPERKSLAAESKIVQHYPTDPIVNTETKTVLKTKSSTSQYEPPKNQSPFRYLIVDPSTIDFRPVDHVEVEIKSTDIDSEEFINEVHESYDRFTKCVRIYEKYNLKRAELKSRASVTKTEKEISELYKEFYRLVEEEKLPFFLKLENEVTILHSKLSKVASLMGIKLS